MIRPGIRRLFRLPIRRRDLAEQELEEELALHLELRAEQLERRGLSPAAAREEALRRFGPMDEARRSLRQAAERREQRIHAREGLAAIRQDLRHGWRQLRASPGFALVAVLTLALGIGANTAIFSLIDATVLRPPEHVREPERLAKVYTSDFSGPSYGGSSYPDYLDFRDGVAAFSGLAAFARQPLTITTREGAEVVAGELVTGSYFQLLGVEPALGRLLVPAEGEVEGRDATVVLGHGLWRRAFGSDPAVVGRAIRVNGQPLTVVGVAPDGFAGPTGRGAAEMWVPLGMASLLVGEGGWREARRQRWLEIVGRLAPGATPERASFQLSAVAQSLFERYPEQWRDVRDAPRSVTLLPGARAWIAPGARGSVVGFLGLIGGLVVLVLTIACANVANLLLARSMRRRPEIALRMALGASRRRIVRQLLTENVLLALLGGAAGVLFAVWIIGLVRGVEGLLPLPLSLDLRVDGRVLGFALLVSLGTVLLFGLLPALLTARRDPAPVLKESAGAGERRGGWLRGALVAGQVAICSVLLVYAALLVQSLRNASSTDLGFDPGGILLVPLQLGPETSAEEARGIHRELMEGVRALPGVDAVALAEIVPLGGDRYQRVPVEPEGYAERAGEDMEIDYNVVSPGYFEMLEIPLVRGRTPDPADGEGAPPVAVVNEAFAARFWPGENALGKRIAVGGDPAALSGAVRAAVQAIDPDIPATGALSFDRAVASQVVPLRLAGTLFTAFALLALAIAMIGLYGVLAYAVSRRLREFGIRIALGADAGRIVRGVVWEGVSLVAAGAVVGLGAALLASRVVAGFLFGVRPSDPAGFVAITLLLLAAAVLASWLPARRATRVDPMVALRRE